MSNLNPEQFGLQKDVADAMTISALTDHHYRAADPRYTESVWQDRIKTYAHLRDHYGADRPRVSDTGAPYINFKSGPFEIRHYGVHDPVNPENSTKLEIHHAEHGLVDYMPGDPAPPKGPGYLGARLQRWRGANPTDKTGQGRW